jgi:hypothetical protein
VRSVVGGHMRLPGPPGICSIVPAVSDPRVGLVETKISSMAGKG